MPIAPSEVSEKTRLAILRGRDGGPSVIEQLAETVKP